MVIAYGQIIFALIKYLFLARQSGQVQTTSNRMEPSSSFPVAVISAGISVSAGESAASPAVSEQPDSASAVHFHIRNSGLFHENFFLSFYYPSFFFENNTT